MEISITLCVLVAPEGLRVFVTFVCCFNTKFISDNALVDQSDTVRDFGLYQCFDTVLLFVQYLFSLFFIGLCFKVMGTVVHLGYLAVKQIGALVGG